MKKILMIGLMLLTGCAGMGGLGSGDVCAPAVSTVSKTSKKEITLWLQGIFSTGTGARMLTQTGKDISVVFGLYEGMNIINLEVKIDEKTYIDKTFRTEYIAAKGNEFTLGFAGGETLRFIANDVANKTEKDYMGDRMKTTVTLSATVPAQTMASMRTLLTTKPIDGVRIVLSGPVGLIEETVDASGGTALMQKFNCFYALIDKKGASMSDGHPKPPAITDLTQDNVKDFLKVQEAALLKGDVEAVMATLAPTYTETNVREGEEDRKLTRQQVESVVPQMAKLENLKLTHENMDIKIDNNAVNAVVTNKMTMTFTKDRKNYAYVYDSRCKVSIQDGVIVTQYCKTKTLSE